MTTFTHMLGAALLAGGLCSAATAQTTVLHFAGTCDNALCTGAGADGTTPATVSASIVLTDLAWVASGAGFEASFTDASDFAYTGPRSFARAETSDVVPESIVFFSNSASVEGIVDFDIRYAGGSAYFAGDASGWGLGTFLSVGGVDMPINFESSTVAGHWTAAAVPEPSSLALLSGGLGVLAWRTGRRRGLARPARPAAA